MELFALGTIYNNRFCNWTYDYQSGETFSGNFSTLSYNVYVINQSDSFGKGPAYLLNGLTNKLYWYQVGVGYNWSKYGTEHNAGFSTISYLEFITPTNSVPIGNVMHTGDKVLLSMNFSDGNVILKVYDWNTGFTNITTFPAYNATYFVGGPYNGSEDNGTANWQGHFTGLMTEWVHANLYPNAEQPIIYAPYTTNYNKTQLFVHNVGPLASPVQSTLSGQLASLACFLDLYNWNKSQLNQSKTSGILKTNNTEMYNFTPYPNYTLQVQGRNFTTK